MHAVGVARRELEKVSLARVVQQVRCKVPAAAEVYPDTDDAAKCSRSGSTGGRLMAGEGRAPGKNPSLSRSLPAAGA